QSRLRRLPASVRRTLVHVAAMSHPTPALARAARPGAADADLEHAVAAGLLTFDGERLRFAHPLLASACYRLAPPEERRAVHRRLAAVVGDPERRARQLALGADGPDAH